MFKTESFFFLCLVVFITNTVGHFASKQIPVKIDDHVNSCRWATRTPVSAGVDVICQTGIIDETFSVNLFGAYHLEQVSSLNIWCDPKLKVKSLIKENIFAHLSRLQELTIIDCKIVFWPKPALSNLNGLKNLTITTRNINWPDIIFELSQDSFQAVTHVEWLDLSSNNIYMLPDEIFCPIVNLRYLNISFNHLNDIRLLKLSEFLSVEPMGNPGLKDIAISSKTIDRSNKNCYFSLRMIDISGNQISVMPSKGLSLLNFLEDLFISKNNINIVSEDALFGIGNLQFLDMSWNKIVQLPENLFKYCSSTIRVVSFQQNYISALSLGLFKNLSHLISLDLSHNQLSDVWMNNNTFAGLIRLVMFNLSHNRINNLDESLFQDMYTLQVLSLEHNQIEILAPNIFKSLSNLHTLHISYNKLTRIGAHSLNGLFVMNWINFSHNKIESFHPQALRNCTGLQDIFISHNNLKNAPGVLRGMHTLQNVDMEKNLIQDIRSTDFEGMTNLHGLILSKNELKHIEKKTFPHLPNLKILSLGGNKIKEVEVGSFRKLPKVEVVRLEDNLLTKMNDMFTEITSLMYLNLSNNMISCFDYAYIPPSLLWLDINQNRISEIGNTYDLNEELQLQTLYVSKNNLSVLRNRQVPQSVKLLFLDNNKIQKVEPYTFKNKTNLVKVDLRGNKLTHLDLISIFISETKRKNNVPKLYIGNNPFVCNCEMDWLQRAHSIHKSGVYPEIADLENFFCKLLYREGQITYDNLFTIDSSKFLCEYEEHCFNLCRCCDYSACDCRMSCPFNCTCYNDQIWATNIVDCSKARFEQVPLFVPMDATLIYLDGNEITELKSHSFIGRIYATTLYLNNSNIEYIRNSTFAGMKSIVTLHLENNKLTSLVGHEFRGMKTLRVLHLEENRIKFIDNTTFSIIDSLSSLYLHGNRLYNFAIWTLNKNSHISGLTLADNPWSCDCVYMFQFYHWIENASKIKILDFNDLRCTIDKKKEKLGTLLKDINSTKLACSSFTGHVSFYTRIMNNASNLIILASAISIIFISLVIFCLIRYRRKLCINCFKLCFNKEASNAINLDQQCQAYITYSFKDESFLEQILLPGLALDDHDLKLRVHHRDFNSKIMTSSEFVINSIEKSEKVIIVLSRNFIYNEWSNPEFKVALNESLMSHRKPLFIIILDFITDNDLDVDLKYYFRNYVSVEWGDSLFWEKLKYGFLKSNKPIYKPFLVQNRTHPRTSTNAYSSNQGPSEFSNLDAQSSSSSQDTQRPYSTLNVHGSEPSVWE